jgi:ATP/ADP translocase
MLAPLAATRSVTEFLADPMLTVACVLLIVVSIGWIVVTRLIVREYRRAAARQRRRPPVDVTRPARDIWSFPP